MHQFSSTGLWLLVDVKFWSDTVGRCRVSPSLLGRAKWDEQKDVFSQGASRLPHVSTIQAATVKLMSVMYRSRAYRALAFRSVEFNRHSLKLRPMALAKSLLSSRDCSYSWHQFPNRVHGGLFGSTSTTVVRNHRYCRSSVTILRAN